MIDISLSFPNLRIFQSFNLRIEKEIVMLQAVRYPYSGSGIGNLGAGCYDNMGTWQTVCPDSSWWSTYGPMIVSIIGSTLTQVGTTWQQQVSNQKILDAVKSATGGGSGVPSAATTESLAQQLATAKGISIDQARAIINNTVGNGVPTPTQYPSWLLPAGIGLAVYLLLGRGKGGA